MQHIVPEPTPFPILDGDARLVGSESGHPPAILLDFIYGAAAYQRWKVDKNVHNKLDSYYAEEYEQAPKMKVPEFDPESASSEADTSNSDDPDWRTGMLDAMDEVMDISWKVRLRMMPEEVAARLQKEEEEELREQEAARMKVLGWMGHTETTVESQ